MITNIEESTSPLVKRQARIEWALDHIVLDAVFKAKETEHLKLLLERDIYASPDYVKLPKYRQLAVEAYFRGVCDAIARVAGAQAPTIAIERPKAAPRTTPKRKPGRPKKVPSLYPSKGIHTPIPEWVHTTIIPPPPAVPSAAA